MSSRDFRGYVDAALARDTSAQSENLQRWLTPTRETRVETVAVADVAEPDWRDPVDGSDPAFRALKASIRASGILQPILLRPIAPGRYEVVSGMRRLKAARDTAQDTVPATVRALGDVEAIVGAWDAVVREGTTPARRLMIERRLLAGGMPQPEISGLLATLQLAAAVAGAGAEPVEAAAPAAPPEVPAEEAAPAPAPQEATPAEPAAGTALEPETAALLEAADAAVEPAAARAPVDPEAAAEPEAPTAVKPEVPAAVEPEVPAAVEPDVPAVVEPEVPAAVEPAGQEAETAAVTEEPGRSPEEARTPLAWVPAEGPETTPDARGEPDGPAAGVDAAPPLAAASETTAAEPAWPSAEVRSDPWSWEGAPVAGTTDPGDEAAATTAAADVSTAAPPTAPPPPRPDGAGPSAGSSPPPAGLGTAWTLPRRTSPPRSLARPSAFTPVPATEPVAPPHPATTAADPATPPVPAIPAPTSVPQEPADEVAARSADRTGSPLPPAPAPAEPPAAAPSRDAAAPIPGPGVEAVEPDGPPRRLLAAGPAPFTAGPRPPSRTPWADEVAGAGAPRRAEDEAGARRARTATAQPPPPSYTPRVLRIDLPSPAAPTVDAGPSDPVVVAPRPGQTESGRTVEAARPVEAPAPARGREATGVDWQLGATAGTFIFVLAVVYIILIVLLGSTTLLVPALVVALVGAAVAIVSMARSRPAP